MKKIITICMLGALLSVSSIQAQDGDRFSAQDVSTFEVNETKVLFTFKNDEHKILEFAPKSSTEVSGCEFHILEGKGWKGIVGFSETISPFLEIFWEDGRIESFGKKSDCNIRYLLRRYIFFL